MHCDQSAFEAKVSTMTDQDKLHAEIEENLRFFEAKLHDLLPDHRNRFALLRNKELVGLYDTLRDAQTTGDKLYPDGIFSVQKVTDKDVNLGIYSYAMHMGNSQ